MSTYNPSEPPVLFEASLDYGINEGLNLDEIALFKSANIDFSKRVFSSGNF